MPAERDSGYNAAACAPSAAAFPAKKEKLWGGKNVSQPQFFTIWLVAMGNKELFLINMPRGRSFIGNTAILVAAVTKFFSLYLQPMSEKWQDLVGRYGQRNIYF